MRKRTYIELIQQKANERIWNYLCDKYRYFKTKNRFLAYLYLPFVCLVFGCISVISMISRFNLLFKDIRFTSHYMQTVIEYNQMNAENANDYLDNQMNTYKKSVSYGNYSVQEQSRINTTFELLYNKYRLPNSDHKHSEIISNLSEIKDVTKENKSSLEKVTLYTEKKQQEEIKEEEKIIELREEREKRRTSAHKREKGRRLTSFESALSDNQISILVNYCNQIPVFERDIEPEEIKDILLCVHKRPLRLTVNKYQSLLFTELCKKNFICATWKSVATRYKCFESAKGNILCSNDYSMANQASGLMPSEKYDLIMKCVNKIAELSE